MIETSSTLEAKAKMDKQIEEKLAEVEKKLSSKIEEKIKERDEQERRKDNKTWNIYAYPLSYS